MTIPRPQVGAIVHYAEPGSDGQTICRAAIVDGSEAGRPTLTVFTRSPGQFARAVDQDQGDTTRELLPCIQGQQRPYRPGTWHWPVKIA